MASERRCHYEVLGLQRDCTTDEIRSAYKKLALQRHPDKLVKSGLSQAEATAQFQELSQAYEILSDPKERAWYDSHRSQILFADVNSANSVPDSVIPNLFSFFSNTVFSGYSDSGRGFYRVYSDVFNKIYATEVSFADRLGLGSGSVREAPAMGNLESPYAQVTAFYGYWLGFTTVMDFCWVDQYDAMAGPNRKSRRVMEEENKKLRKKARREYNETVRGLAEFVKKRDKRVIDMTVKKNLEMEKKREEERERKRRLEKERLERVMAYEEPEWAKLAEEEDEADNGFDEVEEEKKNVGKELYCVVCGKKFKSDKQWKNHEQSKKHREKVAEFRESIGNDEEFEDVEDGEDEGRAGMDDGVELVDDLRDQIRYGIQIGEEEEIEGSDENGFHDVDDGNEMEKVGEATGSNIEEGEDNDDDDEMGVLEAMISGRRNRKNGNGPNEHSSINAHIENDSDEDYNIRKSSRRKGGTRKDKNKKNGGDNQKDDMNGISIDHNKELNEDDDISFIGETSHFVGENENNGKEDDSFAKNKISKQPVDKKGTTKKDTNTKSKNSKGKKAKASSKHLSNTCEACGEEFESRNKLHQHLSNTGHATLKYR
ncbi:DNAJ protein JJJ1 homolog [Ziziphus jujuba]|uniref:DNAJ protein JJJ1 homolog n=1 Tax=Ziziphus jujuba TaxID=326968 RepID=A0A6P6G4J4_ZIZJJ|nr:DNAJ protein JJJ1 homolog [Ziziphus jujuba]XP_024929102.3 DNAJ protein JJJ1 homolog [Ziziphus jujuba]